MDKKRLAFTLIELLVVIAIVGILSGLIIVGMSSSVNSARIAKAQVFSTSLRDSLLMNLISEWKFDGSGIADGSAVTAGTTYLQDSWSGINTCTIPSTAPLVYSGSNCVHGSCLKFNGSSDYLNCGNNVAIGTNSFTWSFWAKTSVSSAGQTVIYRATSGVAGWHGEFKLPNSAATNALFYITDSGYPGGEIYRYLTPSNSSNTTNDKWHFLVGTCDRSQHKAPDTYLDGMLSNGSLGVSYCDLLTTNIPAGNLYIGGTGSGSFFNGWVDDVRMYSAAIPVSQIKEQYYAGITRLLAKGAIAKEDYQNRLNE